MTLYLYLDEDSMDQDLVRALRARGVDIVTALEAGMIERADEDHLNWATSQNRVVYSFNVGDFYHLHMSFLAQGRPHAGMILAVQQRFSVGEQLRRLLRLVAARSSDDMRNHVEFLGSWS